MVDTLDFTKERFFDIDKLMSIFDTIDSVSEMTSNNFDRVYEFIYLVGCKRKIKKRQKVIRDAAGHLKNYILALNFSRTADDPVVEKYHLKFWRSCSGNKCYDAMRYLIGHMKQDAYFKTSMACDFIDLTKESNVRQKVPIYPCYRDYMIMKSASLMQSVM